MDECSSLLIDFYLTVEIFSLLKENLVIGLLQGGQNQVTPQKLYMADQGTRNMSVLSSITILPFSRLFLVGTEDGYLRICC